MAPTTSTLLLAGRLISWRCDSPSTRKYTAREKGWKLEEKAQASLEGIKFGEEAGVGHDWSTKDGFKVSSEDVTHITVGEQGKPAAIFLDLRPLWEIFSPVFFPPNLTVGAVPKKAVAPWIWHELRSSFRQYLEETAGVNKQLDPSNETDYAPRFVKVTFPEFKIWHGGGICMYGNVNLFPTNDGVEFVNAQYWSVSPDQSQRVANGSDLPALDKLTATFGVTPRFLNPEAASYSPFDFMTGNRCLEQTRISKIRKHTLSRVEAEYSSGMATKVGDTRLPTR